MTEERLKEIKDIIDSNYDFHSKFGMDFAAPKIELELYNEVIRLQKRNKEIYDGFMATQEELSDYAKENDRLREENNTLKVKRDLALYQIGSYNMENIRQHKESFDEWLNELTNILRGNDE